MAFEGGFGFRSTGARRAGSLRAAATLVMAMLGAAWAPAFAQAPPLDPASVPAELRGWIDWVRHDEVSAGCPLVAGVDPANPGGRACAWPGELKIEADATGARFAQRITRYARGAVTLPGEASAWPQAVTVNGLAQPVVPCPDGRPCLFLPAGTYELAGRIEWSSRPESLALPPATGLVALVLDGVPVFPLERTADRIWLGRATAAVREADGLSLVVHRRLADGVPAMLETRIELRVTGVGREETLGAPLPAGYVPTRLDGDLPARLDGAGRLIVQVRPGVHRLSLVARATAPLEDFRLPAIGAPWPAEEILSFAADPALRIVELAGAAPIDAGQAGVPGEWSMLPAYALSPGAVLTVVERARGLSAQDQNRLRLTRRLWLDFDGDGLRFLDQITGEMVRGWRLDVGAPLTLLRAEGAGVPLLVTAGGEPGRTGVEVRERQLALTAAGRIDGAASMPVGGWLETFDAVETTLMLPPGYRLYAAPGADRAEGAWIDRFSLLDLFAVAFLVLLAYWYGRLALALPVAALLGLGYFELGAPLLWLLLLALAAALAARALPAGRPSAVAGAVRRVLVVLLVLFALPFAASQLTRALYPQLETPGDLAAIERPVAGAPEVEEPMMMAAPPEAPSMRDAVTAESAPSLAAAPRVVGSREAVRTRYAPDARVQAGAGDPDWRWQSHRLSWAGPVTAAQTVRLVISPPWLTRTIRVATVVLLALVIVALAGIAWTRRNRRAGMALASVAALALGVAPGLAGAQSTPAPELLETLRERALRAPECAPRCAALARLEVEARGDRIAFAAEVHAAARVAVPLPLGESLTRVERLAVDGIAGQPVARLDDGQSYVLVERGVRRVEAVLRVADVDRIALRFPLPPARVAVIVDGWEAGGVRDGRLPTGALELARVRAAEAAGATAASELEQFPPFVIVERRLVLDLDWRIETEVVRVAPAQAAFSVRVPLVPGERPTMGGLDVDDGAVIAAFASGQPRVAWTSSLDRASSLALTAPPLDGRAEVWRIAASPIWNVATAGVPPTANAEPQWVAEFHPLPGETLTVEIARPEPVPGGTIAFDRAALATRVGARATEHTLTAMLRSTTGGQHAIRLPEGAEVLALTVDGAPINARPEDGTLRIPVRPGSQPLALTWRETADLPVHARTAAVDLAAPASNLDLELALPADRWILATHGPALGPAVLYWPALAVLVILAGVVSRTGRTPLRFHQWLLLGLGFSTFSWLALLVVAAWLFALDARARWRDAQASSWFEAVQVGLVVLTAVALLSLVSAIPQGLLGTPDMQITGYGSTAAALKWFADQTEGPLPVAGAFSVSIGWYKLAMLAWALWLANALLGWLRFGWQAWSAGGYWRKPAPKPMVGGAPPPPKPDDPTS
jgi:hypothetical protein